MKAQRICCYQFGKPRDVLEVEEKTLTQPLSNEVVVRMVARPINPSDIIPIYGSYSHRISLPFTPGYEGVGIVEQVGSLVPHKLIGQRVLPLRGEGTWQQYVKTSIDYVVPIPDWMDDVIAAQLYINPVTAWVICTEQLKLSKQNILIVNACGSAIGQIFAQLSKILGFQLIAVVRSDLHTKRLYELGASYVVNSSQVPLRETIANITDGRGADAVVDAIGGREGDRLATCLRPNGTFISIGLLSGQQVNWSEITNVAKAAIFHLRHWNEKVSNTHWHATFQQLIHLIEQRQIQLPDVQYYFDLCDIKEALTAFEEQRPKGKILLL